MTHREIYAAMPGQPSIRVVNPPVFVPIVVPQMPNVDPFFDIDVFPEDHARDR